MNALASPAASSLVRHQPVRAPVDDISAQHWQGGPIDCSVCQYAKLLALGEGLGCEPGYACMQDVYARRIDRFFRWHPTLSDQQLSHPYFEVRAIAARRASVFRLGALIHDPDETVRLQVAMRLPQSQLARLVNDPHREVRIRVAQRLAPADLAALRHDPDYGVRELVAQRLPLALLSVMAFDPDRAVRMHVAQRLEMPALMGMADDPDADDNLALGGEFDGIATEIDQDLLQPQGVAHQRFWNGRIKVKQHLDRFGTEIGRNNHRNVTHQLVDAKNPRLQHHFACVDF